MAENRTTILDDLINPEVMADVISAKVESKIKVVPYAKLDTTLQGQAGDTITIPRFEYIGDAVEVGEGEVIPSRALTMTSKPYSVKKIGIGGTITDEAILSGFGNPVGELTSQMAKSIISKTDFDAIDELYNASTTVAFNSALSYNNIVKGIDAYDEEVNTDKAVFVHPKQVTDLRLDPNFISADKYNNNVMIKGEIGIIANVRVVPSKKVIMQDSYWLNPIVQLNEDAETEDDSAAITVFLKRDTNIEKDRITNRRETEITGDKIYTVALTNDSKVVILKTKAGNSVAPLIKDYVSNIYNYPIGNSTYAVDTTGTRKTVVETSTPKTYALNIAGLAPLIPNETKAALWGADADETNVATMLIEIPFNGVEFDVGEVKWRGRVQSNSDIADIDGKKYLVLCMGLYESGGVITNAYSNTATLAYGDDVRTYNFTYNGLELEV